MKVVRAFLVLAVVFFTATTSCRKDQLTGLFAITPDDFLSSDKYKKLEVEIVYVNGYRPETATIDHMQSFLNARLNKPQGISFIYKSINSPGKSSYTIDDVQKIEKKERVDNTKGKTISAFIFFADAHYSDASVLGTAYGSTSIAIFERTVNENSGGLTQPSKYLLEATACEHEFGHLLGLVDNGTKMVNSHIDGAHGKHCNNQNCLMYYAVETTDVLAIMGGDVPELDENCLDDLRANGGK
jgi:hypothetical protein